MSVPVLLLLRADRVQHSGLRKTQVAPTRCADATILCRPKQRSASEHIHGTKPAVSCVTGSQARTTAGVSSHLPAGAGD